MTQAIINKSDSCSICCGAPSTLHHVVRAKDVAVCGQCGSWYRVPRPTKQDLAKIYDKDYYDSWGLHGDENMTWASKKATFSPLLCRIQKLSGTRDGHGLACGTFFAGSLTL